MDRTDIFLLVLFADLGLSVALVAPTLDGETWAQRAMITVLIFAFILFAGVWVTT